MAGKSLTKKQRKAVVMALPAGLQLWLLWVAYEQLAASPIFLSSTRLPNMHHHLAVACVVLELLVVVLVVLVEIALRFYMAITYWIDRGK